MFLKRCFDLFFTVPGFILLLPLYIAAAALIKLDSHGPVFFRQTRVGRFGQPFRIYKFRTMVVDAELRGAQLTVGRDPRVTRFGEFLRKYKLDELPQLINVLKGEMSLVGPRPEVPRYVAEYPTAIRETVLSVPPGITDLASITFKEENRILGMATDPEKAYLEEVLPTKLDYYVQYANERSLWYDFRLIIATILVLWPGRGGKLPGSASRI
jgi:lipopolysaccharide/colanic/teichoic acid biosynthesis glycosyltransferase